MVCCALLALFFASILWLARKINPFQNAYNTGPLEWAADENPSSGSTPKQGFSVTARAKSFTFAWSGLRSLIKEEHNAWLHSAATLLIVLIAFALKISWADWRWIILCVAMVWIAEAFNTAIEHLSDVVSSAYNDGIKAAKDIAAGAVLISAFLAVAIGMITLLPYLNNATLPLEGNRVELLVPVSI